MNNKSVVALVACICLGSSMLLAEDAPPSMPLSKAAKLAEDAIAAASLPADCYVRSIMYVPAGDSGYFRVAYKPTQHHTVVLNGNPAAAAEPITLDLIKVSLDGKVAFVKEEVPNQDRKRIHVVTPAAQ